MTRNEHRFIELAKYFLFGLNPRHDDEIVCLDCILSCPGDVIKNEGSAYARDFAHNFVNYYYGSFSADNLDSGTKRFIDYWKESNGVSK